MGNEANIRYNSKFDIALPQSIIDSFARYLVSEIRAYYESDEGKAAFAQWKERQVSK